MSWEHDFFDLSILVEQSGQIFIVDPNAIAFDLVDHDELDLAVDGNSFLDLLVVKESFTLEHDLLASLLSKYFHNLARGSIQVDVFSLPDFVCFY